ncbi:hypothetical protein D3C73_1585690 [compost metagenome]
MKSGSLTRYTLRSSWNDSITPISHQSWLRWPNTTPMPRTKASRSLNGTKPFTAIWPEVGTRMPVSILIVVDLPAPFSPI